MTRIVNDIVIDREIEQVFEYVSTPAHWLVWHPSSLGLHGATDHSLLLGEEVTEQFRVAGRQGSVTWRVVESMPPTIWAITGKVAGGGDGTITYSLSAAGSATAFRREFVYRMPNPFAALLDRLFVRRRIEDESTRAVALLKKALEARL